MISIPNEKWEEELVAKGYAFVVGIDEAGRGPLCGPVVAVAAMRREGMTLSEKDARLIRDSKTLSAKQRITAFRIVSDAFIFGIGESSPETIDRMNILQATFLAMKKAIGELKRSIGVLSTQGNTIILTDGDKEIPNLSLSQQAIPQGDGRVRSIAAASIVAKVTRDGALLQLHKEYPRYGFDKHKGYGTREHLEALRKYGPTPIHRFSFRPVREAVDMSGINRELMMLRIERGSAQD